MLEFAPSGRSVAREISAIPAADGRRFRIFRLQPELSVNGRAVGP
jgi:hypothetical protein